MAKLFAKPKPARKQESADEKRKLERTCARRWVHELITDIRIERFGGRPRRDITLARLDEWEENHAHALQD